MMTLHGFFRSTSSWRVRIALNLKGVEHVHAACHLRTGEQRADAYLSLNPQGLVPSLVLENGTDAYGKWNSVFRRYRRWALTGVFDAMLETPAEMAGGSDPPT